MVYYLNASCYENYCLKFRQLWGSVSNSNIETLEKFQSKVLRIITDASRYVPNAVIIRDLQVLSVRQEVCNCSVTYRQRLNDHPNSLAKSLFQRTKCNRSLKRYCPAGLATRYNWCIIPVVSYVNQEAVGTSKHNCLCILFIRLTTCFGHCGPSSGHENM